MRRGLARSCALLLAVALVGVTGAASAQPIVDHPSKLVFPELSFSPPSPEQFRVDLGDGLVVYIAEDPTLPTFEMSARWYGGSFGDPPGKEGLAGMAYTLMRQGGTERMAADDLDARLEFLAASIGTWAGDRASGASVWCLAKDTEEVLSLMADVLFRPAFAEDKIRLERDQQLQALRHRYDSADDLLNTRLPRFLYGDAPPGRLDTVSSVSSITRDDLVTYHREHGVPSNLVVCVSGSFEKQAMLDRIKALFAERSREPVAPVAHNTRTELPGATKPGVYLLNKAMPEVTVQVVHLGIDRHNPDFIPLQIMNRILNSPKSGISKRVRDDEGLAYGAWAFVGAPVGYAGSLGAGLSCKGNDAAYAISLALEQLRAVREKEVDDAELSLAKESWLNTFPAAFSTPFAVLERLASLEFDGLPMDYYQTLREQISKVTKADVLRVARDHVQPERFLVVISGDAALVQGGNPDHPASVSEFGEVRVIEPGDPGEGT